MERSPLVSVIVPVYNMEQYLGETLDSVLASDYPSFEVIVMDDGSKDASLLVAKEYARKDTRIKVYTQPNAGACAARNHAISLAEGELILPVDADNTITPEFIRKAVEVIVQDEDIKVVSPRADFFGDRSGEWLLPPFSLKLLARKNIMDTCALYKKSDWVRVKGYCEEIIAREDWDFWISVLKEGGKVVRLPAISLHYRIRNSSKRVTDRSLKKHVINVLNKRHPEFFERELGGPLHYRRTWSRLLNKIDRLFRPRRVYVNPDYSHLADFIKTLSVHFKNGEGTVIYKGRNELREFEKDGVNLVVKSFCTPNIINRIVYGLFRSSKAERSYRYAEMFLKSGIGTPVPVGYYTERAGLLFSKSYYVCLKSECPYTYRDFKIRTFPRCTEILQTIGRITARIHEAGYLHNDYSAGNILFRDDREQIEVEVIDLNRMSFGKVDMVKGCKNFERLPGTDEMLSVLATTYAEVRGFDPETCSRLIKQYVEIEEKKRENSK